MINTKLQSGNTDVGRHVLDWLRQGKFTTRTMYTYIEQIKHFLAVAPHNICDIKAEHLEQSVLIYSKNHSPSSVNLHIGVLQSFFRYLHRNRICDNFGDYLQCVQTLPAKKKVLSRVEFLKVLLTADGHRRDVFLFLCNTGLRASEFCSLTKYNISNDFVRVIGKGRKNRSIPMNAIVKEIVQRDPELSFIRGRSRWWLCDVIDNLGQKAGVKFNPHACRHYFSNTLFRKKVPIAVISRILGHASTAVTEKVYLEWLEEDLRGATDCLCDNDDDN